MKIRTSFIANSSSSSFLLLVKNDDTPKLRIKDLNITIDMTACDQIEFDDEDCDTWDGIPINYTPKNINDVLDYTIQYLNNKWYYHIFDQYPYDNKSSKQDFISEYSSNTYKWSRYNNKNHQSISDAPSLEELEIYYDNFYDYVVNTYKLSQKLLNEYFNNYINLHLEEIKSYAYTYNTFTEFFKNCMAIDKTYGIQIKQILQNYKPFLAIFKNNPISIKDSHPFSAEKFKLYNDNKKEIEETSLDNYVFFINIYSDVIKILYALLYCHFANKSFQSFSAPYNPENNSIVDIIDNVFADKNILSNVANFELFETENE